jgi:hypothetical protein
MLRKICLIMSFKSIVNSSGTEAQDLKNMFIFALQ